MKNRIKANHDSRIRVQHLRNCRGITTFSGPETYLLDLARNIDRSRFDLRIALVVNSREPHNLLAEQLRGIDVEVEVIPTHSAFDFSDLRFLQQTRSRCKPGILVSHDARSDVIAWCARKRLGIPWIAFAHGWANWGQRLSKAWLYAQLEVIAVRRATIALVASAHMHKDLIKRGNAAERIRCIPIGIDVDRFTHATGGPRIRDELGIDPTAAVVGLVGRIHPWKGQTVFINAASQVLRTHPKTHFVLVGDIAFSRHRHYLASIETLIRQLDIGQQVQLTGTRQDIPDIMSALDICVVSSLQEPYGLVAIEAQAAGAPVIASDVGGLGEIVADGISGRLIPAGDSARLAATIVEFLNDRESCRSMGQRGQERAAAYFSSRAMIRKTHSLYTELAQNGN